MARKNQDEAADKLDNIEIVPQPGDAVLAPESESAEPEIPEMGDLKWHEYVLTQFADDELVDGNPTVDGLRRIVHKVLGPIISSIPVRESPPSIHNNYHAMVSWQVSIDFGNNDIRTFGDVADVCEANTHPEYAIYSSATAATRAEGRALRKALQLKRVIAAEEVGSTATTDTNMKINVGQISFIEMMCERLDINIMKLLNLSKKFKVDKIEDMSYASAIQINKFLSQCQNGKDAQGKPRVIPDNVKGYDPNWRNK